jgi:predicted unusual protein kinase regulating ubiquinone biosynthesis (AarF/ABC1/UbiB family)
MFEEIDYVQERRNAVEIRAALADRPDVVIPDIVPELCTGHTLALEYCQGTKISRVEALRARGIDLEQLMLRIVELYAHMILIKGIYQADPHPGNIFIHEDGRIILVDFGIVRRLSAATRELLVTLIVAALKKDSQTVVDNLYKIGLVKVNTDREVVHQVAVKVADLHFQGLATRTRLQEVAQTILNSFAEFPIEVPPELIYVFRTLSLLEGLGTRFRPGWNMLADGAPAIRTVLRQYLVESRGLIDTVKEYFSIFYRRLFG